jgi:tetratricopeptide (TPR) repeat protein
LFNQACEYIDSEERMGGFLLEPFCTLELFDPALEPGELLGGRFRIVRKIGEGGMAIVYEAIDVTLNKHIAVKCAKVGFDTRLTPEVVNATKIAHDNVCKIFDFHSAGTDRGEIDFITMEFLDGPTLADRLSAGALPEREARAIALQLCAGLSAAHRNHVIHGDLKSNNIILTRAADGSLRAVITDFGLARSLQAQPEDARPSGLGSAVGGAPAYMAPELRNGVRPSVSSDVYALGCICYEMLSGARVHGEPLRVHPKWNGILARCLCPDPSRRYGSVEEIKKALAPKTIPRWALAAAGVVFAAVSVVVTYRMSLAPAETIRLALVPFETDAGNRDLSDGLLNQTAEQLRRVMNTDTRRLVIIPFDATVQNKLDRPDKAVQLLNATHVLNGTLRRDNGRTLIHAYLTGAHSQIPLNELQAGYQVSELRGVPLALAGMITGTLHLPPGLLAATVNAVAYADFTKGIGLLQRNATDEAIQALENAVRADPESPLTHAWLALAQIEEYRSTNDPRWMESAILSLGNARQRNPDVAEVWLASGTINQYRGLYEAAEADLRRALEIESQNGDIWRRLGLIYQSSNRFDQALDAYRKAIQLQPSYFKNYQALCNLFTEKANYGEAIRQCTTMVALAPDLSESYFARANPYFYWGRYPEAEIDLRTALRLDPNSFKAIQLLAGSLVYEGRYMEAISLYRRALEIGPETHLLYLDLGQTLRWAGLPSEARQAYSKGVALADLELAKNSRDEVVRARLAYMLARLGQRTRAEAEAVLALQPNPAAGNAVRWVVMAYEAMGLRERALAIAEVASDDALRRLDRSPDMADFRKDSQFQRLTQSRHIQ